MILFAFVCYRVPVNPCHHFERTLGLLFAFFQVFFSLGITTWHRDGDWRHKTRRYDDTKTSIGPTCSADGQTAFAVEGVNVVRSGTRPKFRLRSHHGPVAAFFPGGIGGYSVVQT